MSVKRDYDRKHLLMFFKIDDHVLLRLHKNYNILFIKILSLKLSQQYVDSFKILKKVDFLFYRLKIFSHWRIHLVFIVAQLKSISSTENSFNRSRSNHFDFVFVKDDTNLVKSYEISHIVRRRSTKKRGSKYLVRWKGYESQYDEWRNILEMKNVMKLIKKYEDVVDETIYLLDRLRKTFTTKSIAISRKRLFSQNTIKQSFATPNAINVVLSKSSHTRSSQITDSRMAKSSAGSLIVIFRKSETGTSASIDTAKAETTSALRRFVRLLLLLL